MFPKWKPYPKCQKRNVKIRDKWITKFLVHLATDKGASIYTQRNYQQALTEFARWHQAERKSPAAWDQLQRDDFSQLCAVSGPE